MKVLNLFFVNLFILTIALFGSSNELDYLPEGWTFVDEESEMPLQEVSLDAQLELEEKFLNICKDFEISESTYKDGNFDAFQKRTKQLERSLESIFKHGNQESENFKMHSERLVSYFEEIIYTKYKKDILLNHGVRIAENHCYRIFFEEEGSKFDQTQIIRFKIHVPSDSKSCAKNLRNAYIKFLNKKGFELYRCYIGDVYYSKETTGKFEIPKTYYQEFYDIGLSYDSCDRK